MSSLNNKFDTFFEHVNTISSFITELREKPRIESSNINFLQSNIKNETIRSLILTQAKALDTVANLKHRSNMETEINSQRNKLTKQQTVSLQNEEHQSEECHNQPQHQQKSHKTNCKHNRETEKFQNEQQKPVLQEQLTSKIRIEKDTIYKKTLAKTSLIKI